MLLACALVVKRIPCNPFHKGILNRLWENSLPSPPTGSPAPGRSSTPSSGRGSRKRVRQDYPDEEVGVEVGDVVEIVEVLHNNKPQKPKRTSCIIS